MSQGAFSNLAQYSAPFRRFAAWAPARHLVLAIGLIAMTAFTVPEVRNAAGIWLSVCLWCCFGFFAVESALRLRASWAAAGTARRHIFSPSGLVDLLGIVPVPIALLCGAEPQTAWLFAALWVLKLGQDSPGFRPARTRVRARSQTAGQRAGAVPDRAFPRLGRHACPRARRSAGGIRHDAGRIVVGRRHAEHHRLWRRSSAYGARPSARLGGDDLRHRDIRLVDWYLGDRLRLREPPPQFHRDLGPGQQSAVLPNARPDRDHRNHPYAAARGNPRTHRRHPPRPGRRLYVFHRRRRSRGRCRADAGPARCRCFLRRAGAARRFHPHRECRDDHVLDPAHSRPCRFPHPDGASFRARPRHRRRGQKAARRKSAPARAPFARRRCRREFFLSLRGASDEAIRGFAFRDWIASSTAPRNDAGWTIAIFL